MAKEKLNLVTIVLNGMPYISQHLAEFERIQSDWHWFIVEGQAMPTKDTSWCKPMPPGLSSDGTTEYLNSLKAHPRVTVIQRESWPNKTDQINAAVNLCKADGVLMQIDSDEMWKAKQLDKIMELFRMAPDIHSMEFFCRYFIGPDIVTIEDNSYGNNSGEWLRAWRFRRGMLFNRHEPPVLNLNRGKMLRRNITKKHGLVFDHFSWVQRNTVEYKEKYYGYAGAVAGWDRLQSNSVWPCKLKPFLHWVDERAIADKVR